MFELFGIGIKAGVAAQISLRVLRVSHSTGCAQLHAKAFAHPWSVAELEALLADSATFGDGATIGHNQPLAGFALSRLAADEAEILSIVVESSYRRRGIGRKLLLSHMGRLAGAGAGKIFLEVDDHNIAALTMYSSLGFNGVGRRRAYYKNADGTFADALILRCDLG